MNIFSMKTKWFLSFAFAALLTTGIYSGCQNSSNPSDPTLTQMAFDPSTLNPIAANGVDLGPTMAIQNRHTDDLMAIDGVVGTGTGLNTDGTPAVYVFTSRDGVTGIPASLEGVHTYIKNIGIVQAFSGVFSGLSQSPTESGYSVGNNKECAAGTISCVVTDNATSSKYFLLSNNHVFARVNAAAIGEAIDQPGLYDAVPQCTGPVIHEANLSRFITINFARRSTNTVDCAIAQLQSGITATTRSAGGYTPTATNEAASVGLQVKKTGRTTGLTNGTIAAINVTTNVSYGNGKTAKFTGQIYISSTTFSGAGDSGSLIVDNINNDPVGLLFAGSSNSTIANPIGAVFKALDVHIVIPPPGF